MISFLLLHWRKIHYLSHHENSQPFRPCKRLIFIEILIKNALFTNKLSIVEIKYMRNFYVTGEVLSTTWTKNLMRCLYGQKLDVYVALNLSNKKFCIFFFLISCSLFHKKIVNVKLVVSYVIIELSVVTSQRLILLLRFFVKRATAFYLRHQLWK